MMENFLMVNFKVMEH